MHSATDADAHVERDKNREEIINELRAMEERLRAELASSRSQRD